MANQRISQAGVELIASFEGFRGNLYNDPAGHATIGFGHLVHRGPINGSEPEAFRRGITREEALALLRQDAARFEAAVNQAVRVPLSQPQFDALVSWVFNVGSGALQRSDLLRRLNAGEYDAVPGELQRWNRAGGRVLQGLVRRRLAESLLFAAGYYEHQLPPVRDPLPFA